MVFLLPSLLSLLGLGALGPIAGALLPCYRPRSTADRCSKWLLVRLRSLIRLASHSRLALGLWPPGPHGRCVSPLLPFPKYTNVY